MAALDKYARLAGLESRSAAIQHAIRLLADAELEDAYERAFAEWEQSADADADADARGGVSGDGIRDAAG